MLANILHEVSPDDVVAAFTAASSTAIALSIAFTFASYLALTGYDGLALRQIGAENVPYSTAAIGSFTSYAISYTLGLPLLTAGTVRYRVYGGAGLTAPQIAALTLVCTLTFWLGMGAVLALGLIFVPAAVGQIDRLPDTLNMAIGRRRSSPSSPPMSSMSRPGGGSSPCEGWSLPLPGGRVTIIQILLGVVDVCAGAGALYVLLPERGVDALRHLRGDLCAGRRARRGLPRARRDRRLRGDDAGGAAGHPGGPAARLDPPLPCDLLFRALRAGPGDTRRLRVRAAAPSRRPARRAGLGRHAAAGADPGRRRGVHGRRGA